MKPFSKVIRVPIVKIVQNTFRMVLDGPSRVLEFPNVFEAGDFPEPLLPERFRGNSRNVLIADPIELLNHLVCGRKLCEFRMLQKFRPSGFLNNTPILPTFKELVAESGNEFKTSFPVPELRQCIFSSFDSAEFFLGELLFLDHGFESHPDRLPVLEDILCHMEPFECQVPIIEGNGLHEKSFLLMKGFERRCTQSQTFYLEAFEQ